jgi:transcriptional regulator with XRE-family HTH domain
MGKNEPATVGEKIRLLRKRTGLSIYALAAAAGMSRINLSRIERGVNAPSWGAARRLAAALGVGLADLDLPAAGPA